MYRYPKKRKFDPSEKIRRSLDLFSIFSYVALEKQMCEFFTANVHGCHILSKEWHM